MTDADHVVSEVSPATAGIAALVVDADGLAVLLDISARQVHRLDSGGKLPSPISFGRCKRWGIEEIKAWIAEGAPSRQRWNAARNLRSALAAPRTREQGQ